MSDNHPKQPEAVENDAPATPDQSGVVETINKWKLTPEEKEEIFSDLRELQDMGVLDNQPD
ncbi:hypothetical protein Mal4_25260 [Maioricimonas rarisocia]|uniref:Uncharacterized protein n=1 Tax=Maioricimonas rarisocia TaxID=2528026 RepID=A0A517Z6Z4_9PLAN|nr:hypothetical protein [Maioricimonas rarisocia]QDU38201.1 hypothetical protein Mal4_25260 [Maioricimonas rarisocia]